MLANAPLLDARPAVVICPQCAQHLMDIKDVQWAAAKLEFTFECSGCGTELRKEIAGEETIASYMSQASAFLQKLEIFSFNPERLGRTADRRGSLGVGQRSDTFFTDSKRDAATRIART